jgi:tetratricopeptide (TPR) repeat protein
MTLKTRLIDILNTMREQQLAFPVYLTKEERNQVGEPDDWSAKDEIIHITVWANYHFENLKLRLKGGTPPDPIYAQILDEKNRSIFDENKDAGWDRVLDDVGASYDRVDNFIKRHSDDLLLEIPPGEERPVWRIIAGSHIIHPMIHLWGYLQHHEHNNLLTDLFGDDFITRLIDLHEDQNWHGTVYYDLACIVALSGRKEEAINTLAKALQLNPKLAEWSQQDSDLESLHDHPAFQALYTDL